MTDHHHEDMSREGQLGAYEEVRTGILSVLEAGKSKNGVTPDEIDFLQNTIDAVERLNLEREDQRDVLDKFGDLVVNFKKSGDTGDLA